jgi:hypothetical protein
VLYTFLVLGLTKDVPFDNAIFFLVTLLLEGRLEVAKLLGDTIWSEERQHIQGETI